MHEGDGDGIVWFRRMRAQRAKQAIDDSEGRLSGLRLTPADLKPAKDALEIARDFFGAHQFSKALKAAQKAETLATALDARFHRYQEAEEALRARVVSMRRLGLRTGNLESTLGTAEETVVSGLRENGIVVPNYDEARALLERTERDGHAVEKKAMRASDEILRAEVAIESLASMAGPAGPWVFSDIAGSALEQSLQDATEELALGNADGAGEIAQDITTMALRLKAQSAAALESLERMEAQLAQLRAEGILTAPLEGQMRMAREALESGLIEPAAAMATRLRGEVASLDAVYREATHGLADAELLYARLQREGFQSYEADAAMRDARRSIREGKYARGVDHVDRVLRAFARPANAREAHARALDETRTRALLLQGNGFGFFPETQEIIARAEREFQRGNLLESSEDLRIATVLLDRLGHGPRTKG